MRALREALDVGVDWLIRRVIDPLDDMLDDVSDRLDEWVERNKDR